jgi:hypothetical protein
MSMRLKKTKNRKQKKIEKRSGKEKEKSTPSMSS